MSAYAAFRPCPSRAETVVSAAARVPPVRAASTVAAHRREEAGWATGWVSISAPPTRRPPCAGDGRIDVVPLGTRRPGDPVAGLRAARRRGAGRRGGRAARRHATRAGWPASSSGGSATRWPCWSAARPYSAQALMARLLRAGAATPWPQQQGGPPDAVTVTHPANWGPFKRDLLDQAVRMAGLAGVRMCSEPEAAAIAVRRGRAGPGRRGDRGLRPRRRHVRRGRAAQDGGRVRAARAARGHRAPRRHRLRRGGLRPRDGGARRRRDPARPRRRGGHRRAGPAAAGLRRGQGGALRRHRDARSRWRCPACTCGCGSTAPSSRA